MVVGDDDQAIYGFRGADFTNILNFNKDFKNVFEVKLERNYRSASVIVETANNLIQHNNMRKGKASYANEDKDGGDVRVAASRNNEEEGRFISEEIKRLVNKESYDYKDITILYRVNSQSFQMEKYLNKYSIPYEVIGGTKFLERKECQMFLGFLQFSLNPLDDLNISSIIGYYRNNLGRTTIKKLKEYSFENNISLLETMKNPEKVKGIGKSRAKSITQFLKNYLIPMNQLKDFNLPLMDIVKRVDKISDIERLLNNMSNSRDRKENLDQLKVYMFDIIEKNKEYSLEDLLDHVKLHSGQEVMSESEEESDNKVKLMTAHSSKGLEFPVVFVIGLEEKLFPHSFAINEGTELAIEEERRLAYVAFTRAEEKLYLSYAKFRYKYGQGMPTVRSRFLDELVS
jgi:DNA helicase-2/ATP-dependent DNA helicase PcrA